MLSWELAAAAVIAVVWLCLLRHGMLEAPGGAKGPGRGILNMKSNGARSHSVVWSQSLTMLCTELKECWTVWVNGSWEQSLTWLNSACAIVWASWSVQASERNSAWRLRSLSSFCIHQNSLPSPPFCDEYNARTITLWFLHHTYTGCFVFTQSQVPKFYPEREKERKRDKVSLGIWPLRPALNPALSQWISSSHTKSHSLGEMPCWCHQWGSEVLWQHIDFAQCKTPHGKKDLLCDW